MDKYGEMRRGKSKRRPFIGWRSEQLSGFLTAVGKDSDVPLPESEVCDIVFKYIHDKRLLHPGNKKKVICDPVLHSLLRRKSFLRLRISDLLAPHFADNLSSEDEEYGSWFGENLFSKPKGVGFCMDAENAFLVSPELPRKGFASVSVENVKFLHLKRSLVMQFLKNADSFEEKVVGSVVRVKSELQQIKSGKSMFYLALVSGVVRLLDEDGTNGTAACFALRASDIENDIRIAMVSDSDFTEEECDDLKQRVNQGLVRRVSVADFEKKAQSLRKLIIDHWIGQELSLLQNKIDRANEKGLRRELFEYMESKELLETPEEQSRLLAEPITIVADPDIEEFENQACLDENVLHNTDAEKVTVFKESSIEIPESEMVKTFNFESEASSLFTGACEATSKICNGRIERQYDDLSITSVNIPSIGQLEREKSEIVMTSIGGKDGKIAETHAHINGIEVIEIDDDDENGKYYEYDAIWHYEDPHGNMQGPFPLKNLRLWKEQGYFRANFEVWKTGQDEGQRILLKDLLH